MTTRNKTRWHNLDFLKTKLKLSQLGNSAVFKKDGKCFLSPAVSEGQHGKYWIDIREANLNKIDRENCFFIPRIVPDLFIFENIKYLSSLLSEALMECRPHSGNVWGIYMKLIVPSGTATLYSKQSSENQMTVKLISKDAIIKTVREVFN